MSRFFRKDDESDDSGSEEEEEENVQKAGGPSAKQREIFLDDASDDESDAKRTIKTDKQKKLDGMMATCKAIRGHIKADPTPDWNSIKRGAHLFCVACCQRRGNYCALVCRCFTGAA